MSKIKCRNLGCWGEMGVKRTRRGGYGERILVSRTRECEACGEKDITYEIARADYDDLVAISKRRGGEADQRVRDRREKAREHRRRLREMAPPAVLRVLMHQFDAEGFKKTWKRDYTIQTLANVAGRLLGRIITARRVGSIVRGMGLKVERLASLGGRYGVVYEASKVARLCEEYGIGGE